jgi:hypothetical protein
VISSGGSKVIGIRWVKAVTLGAYGKSIYDNALQTVVHLSSWYRADPVLFTRFRTVLRSTNPDLWKRSNEIGIPPTVPL